jgi:hypothetical protein
MDGAHLVNVETAKNRACAGAAIGMPPDEFYAAIEGDGLRSRHSRRGLSSPSTREACQCLPRSECRVGVGVAGALIGADDWSIAEKALGGQASHSHHRNDKVCMSAAAVAPESSFTSQLHPNNWVPVRPAQSRMIQRNALSGPVTGTDWDEERRGGISWASADLPRNAQVVGSSPTSDCVVRSSIHWIVSSDPTQP